MFLPFSDHCIIDLKQWIPVEETVHIMKVSFEEPFLVVLKMIVHPTRRCLRQYSLRAIFVILNGFWPPRRQNAWHTWVFPRNPKKKKNNRNCHQIVVVKQDLGNPFGSAAVLFLFFHAVTDFRCAETSVIVGNVPDIHLATWRRQCYSVTPFLAARSLRNHNIYAWQSILQIGHRAAQGRLAKGAQSLFSFWSVCGCFF